VTKNLQTGYDLRKCFNISVLKSGWENSDQKTVQPGVSLRAERETAIVREGIGPMCNEVELLFKLILRERA